LPDWGSVNVLVRRSPEHQRGRMKFLRLGLVALLTFGFLGCSPSPPKHGLEFVLTAKGPTGEALSWDEVSRVTSVLGRRLDHLGVRTWVETVGTNAISVKMDPDSKEQIEAVRMTLVRRGLLEFRLEHPEAEKLMREGIIPGDYQVLTQTTRWRGVQGSQSHLVSRKAVPGLGARNLTRVAVGRGEMNDPQILFSLDPEGAATFTQITTQNVGRGLAIVVDGILYSMPRIRTPITGGNGVISGSLTDGETSALVAILQSSLDAKVEIVEERRF